VDNSSQQVESAYAHLRSCERDDARIAATARLILTIFDDFYAQLCAYPFKAKRAFETRDPHASIQISHERLGLYSQYISEHGPRILGAFPALANNADLWDTLDRLFMAMIVDRYEADTAFSFAHSLRRNIDHGLWKPVAYSFAPPSKRRANSMAAVYRRLCIDDHIDVDLILAALQMPQIATAFADLQGDACRILDKLHHDTTPTALDVCRAGRWAITTRQSATTMSVKWPFSMRSSKACAPAGNASAARRARRAPLRWDLHSRHARIT